MRKYDLIVLLVTEFNKSTGNSLKISQEESKQQLNSQFRVLEIIKSFKSYSTKAFKGATSDARSPVKNIHVSILKSISKKLYGFVHNFPSTSRIRVLQ